MALLRGNGRTRTISERGFIRSDRSPEDRRPIGDLTSKPRPNSEPALFFPFSCANRGTIGDRETSWPSAGTSHGDDEVYFFPLHEPSRDPWHTARLRALERIPWPPLPPEPESTCYMYLPRRAPINGFRDRGERRLCPTAQ